MSAPPPTDLELVRGLHARDRRALARVYGDHHAAIYNLCARILGDREEAKDVTQEVFLKALTTPPPAREDVRLRPWLFRVATNACLNLIRARRSGGGDIDMLAASRDPYEQARQAALIETSLASINERYRAALVLKDLHGLAGGELADVLDVSRPTADVLVHRARTAFRKTFTRLAGEDAVAPANLALALPALAVPAALQALPAGLAQLAAGAAAATAAAPAAGVLAKLGAALTSKAAVVAAGATLVAGGGIAAIELTGGGVAPAPASRPAPSAGLTDGATTDAASSPRDAWAGHRRAVEEHAGDHRAADHGTGHDRGHGTGHDGGGAGHDGSHAQASTGEHSGGDTGGDTGGHDATTYEPAGHDAAGSPGTTSSSSTTTATSGGHEGGDGDHGGGHD
jgi:RNA polymerase sigma-70 factor (ECF subfamily)